MIFIFDGWDELSDEHKKSSLISKIISGQMLYNCSVIVTSCTYAYSSLVDMIQEYNMDVNKHINVIGSLPHGIKLCIEQEFPWSEKRIASTTLVYTSHGQEKLPYHILFPTLVTSEPPMDIALYNLVT